MGNFFHYQEQRTINPEKVSDSGRNFEEDITFAKRTKEAQKMYEKGHFKEMNARDFVN